MKEPNYRERQLGRNIRDIRLEKGMTLEEFCNEFDDPKPSPSIISRWERGVSTPSPKRLKRLGELGNVDIGELYKGGLDFFGGQLEQLADVYEKNRADIRHDLSQSYHYFRLGQKYITFARKTSGRLLEEYENFLYLIDQSLTSDFYKNYANRYGTIRNEIIQQLDRLHLLVSYPAFIADVKERLDETIKTDMPVKTDTATIMENAKKELLNDGTISDETISDFCKLFDCDRKFATDFLNNRILPEPDDLKE